MKRFLAVLPMLLLTFVVSCGRADNEDPAEQAFREAWPGLLNEAQIEDFLNAKLQRDRNPDKARIALNNALLELIRKDKPDRLYRAVYWFKLSRAYGQVLNTEEERKFAGASKRLTKVVQAKYLFAFVYAKEDDYKTAISFLQELLAMLPEMGPGEDKNELRKNVAAHIAWIKRFILTDQ